jgi:hypothetical protein
MNSPIILMNHVLKTIYPDSSFTNGKTSLVRIDANEKGWSNVVLSEIKKNLSDFEIRGIKEYLNDYGQEYLDLDSYVNHLGLAYTSSSGNGVLNVCNGEFTIGLDDWQVSHFVLTESDLLIAVCFDTDENECLIRLN